MPSRVEVHPTAKIAAYALTITLLVSFTIVGAKRIFNHDAHSKTSELVTSNRGIVNEQNTQLYFSPRGGCTDAIVKELGKANNSIHVLTYSFTSEPIANALVLAKRRGVDVEVLFDKSQLSERNSEVDHLTQVGIPTFVETMRGIAHNKVMIIDGETVITGSFNFTKAAEDSNAENLLVIHDAKLASKYLENWEANRLHSTTYIGK